MLRSTMPSFTLKQRIHSFLAFARDPLAYFPFGAGPHSCIGMSLAMVELLLAVVTIVRSYQIERITEEPVEAKMQPSLRPVAFTMRVKKRVQGQLLVEQ
ncbi:cytochrome P450 [Ktedonobacter robiniae]|uniref:Cytochrome P450 n=1 Tax=Ktedonobacter robiniae TaxID=2778365 RepID=A0ABQ3V133_9CHLR|nr:cytochrome P450 [Ktedonobacter robiniae]GHO58355.1 hypothetical protein KSB_68300 [Ktedonobacter robiniae]